MESLPSDVREFCRVRSEIDEMSRVIKDRKVELKRLESSVSQWISLAPSRSVDIIDTVPKCLRLCTQNVRGYVGREAMIAALKTHFIKEPFPEFTDEATAETYAAVCVQAIMDARSKNQVTSLKLCHKRTGGKRKRVTEDDLEGLSLDEETFDF